MRLLVFDPGETTGVALLDEGIWQFGMSIPLVGVDAGFFDRLIVLANPMVVLIEEPPLARRDDKAAEVYYTLCMWTEAKGIPLEKVNPGQWKGMVNKVSLSSNHEQDALMMGQWFLKHIRARAKLIVKAVSK